MELRETGRARDDRGMPHNWLIVDANTPEPWNSYGKPTNYRNKIREQVERPGSGAKFVELYWDATKPVAYVLVNGPKEPEKLRALSAAQSFSASNLPTFSAKPGRAFISRNLPFLSTSHIAGMLLMPYS